MCISESLCFTTETQQSKPTIFQTKKKKMFNGASTELSTKTKGVISNPLLATGKVVK